MQFVKKTILPEQVFSGVKLNHSSVVEYHDVVCVPDSGHAMGDDDGGSALPERLKRIIDQILRFRIKRRCGFIQNQQLGISKESPCDGNPLTLPH